MGFLGGRSLFFVEMSLFALWNVCSSLRIHTDTALHHNHRDVINLLEALNVTHSVRGVTKVKGRDPGMWAWRFRSRTPHLTLPPEHWTHPLDRTLSFHLIGQQSPGSEATLLSLTNHGRVLLRLISNTRSNWLRLETGEDVGGTVEFSGGSPFARGGWVELALTVEPERLVLFVDCQEAQVLQLTDPMSELNTAPHSQLLLTFSSTAGDRASKFSGNWQTAVLSLSAFERRPWHCDSVTDSPIMPVSPDVGVAHDQPQRGGGLGPPAIPQGRVSPSSDTTRQLNTTRLNTTQRISTLEQQLQALNSMLNMLKTQNADLQARVQYLESCECVRRVCEWEGREVQEGSRWVIDRRTVCSCISGHVQCASSDECSFEGKLYSNDEVFNPDPCSTCVCENGQVECKEVLCSSLSCVETFVPQGQCCPICRPGCEYDGGIYEDGDVFASRVDPCIKCSCTNSEVRCSPTHCPPTPCSNPYKRPGECCPTCSACDLDGQPYNGSFSTADGCQTCNCQSGEVLCVDVEQCPQSCRDGVKHPFGSCCRDCSRCDLHGDVILDGVSFPDRRDPCTHCTCTGGNIMCTAALCPSLDCTELETVEGDCCPRCKSCVHDGKQYQHNSQWRDPQNHCSLCTCSEGCVQCEMEECNLPCKSLPTPHPGACCPVCDGCGVNGLNFLNGQRVPSDTECEECVCRNGDLQCSPLPCPATPCSHPIKRLGECCPRCEQCEYESELYLEGQSFSSRVDPCLSCRCLAGEVVCERKDTSCPSLRCTHPAKTPGECCPTCNMCEHDGAVYADGTIFNPVGNGACIQCKCKRGTVRCHKVKCPPVLCPHPVTDPQHCCPVCNVCVVNEVEFEDGAQWESDTHPCSSCSCVGGEVVCTAVQCPPVTCPHPTQTHDECCASCERCTFNQRIYENGQTFSNPDKPCQICTCQAGSVQCNTIECPPVTCINPQTLNGHCCPQCQDCDFENRVYVNGESFPSPVKPCEACVCVGGEVNCQDQQCPNANCQHPIEGTCCHNNCNGCSYSGKDFPNGMEFPHPTDSCRTCHCLNGNVQCLMKRCPPLPCSDPYVTPGECCPQCPVPPADCVLEGRAYRHTQRFYHHTDSCQSCICTNGSVSCQRKPCPPARCTHPILQECCRTCDGCLYGGQEHANGAVFSDLSDPCAVCVCLQGSVSCEKRRCPLLTCPHPTQGECCHSCDGCRYDGVEYMSGQEFLEAGDQCAQCVCVSGHVTCRPKPCYSPGCSHPVTLTGHCCPVCDGCFFNNMMLLNGQTVPDESNTCSECTCRAGSVQCVRRMCATARCPHPVSGPCGCPVCEGCMFQGETYADGDSFSPPKGACEECKCNAGEVRCSPRLCPKVTCSHPATDVCACPVCEDCRFRGRHRANGERFPDPRDPCRQCACLNGRVSCESVACPAVECSRPERRPGECCPTCTGVCEHLGQAYESGTTFTPPTDHCSICTCLAGEVTCEGPQCPDITCMHQTTDPGSCCPRCRGCVYEAVEHPEGSVWIASSAGCMSCMCVDGVTTCSDIQCLSPCHNQISVPGECCPVCADCLYDGHVYSPGESFSPTDDPCQICTCEVMPHGEQYLRCVRKQCPSLVDCPKHNILFSGPDSCCPVCAQPLSNCTATLIGNEVLATDDPCFTCHCKDLTWTCVHQSCLPLSCPHTEQITPPDSCCPVCNECVIEGGRQRVPNGQSWTDSVDECITCTCNLGYIECDIEECTPRVCEDGLVKVKTPGKCCYECQDTRVQCVYEGQVYNSEDQWELDGCTTCTCVSGDVHCHTQRCPTVSCASDEILSVVPGMCCPRCLPLPASCVVFGDPHYQTFDRKMISFQGACTYVLAQDCEGGDFSVHVTNEDRGRQGVSWTKEVTVFIGDVVVQLLQNWVVKVDYQTVSLPFLKEPYVFLTRKTNTILLNTNIGLEVLWNGRSHLELKVPGTYKKKTCGLCGNFNNFPQDDMKLRNGQITNSEATFGNDWKVQTGNHSRTECSDGQNVDPCKAAGYFARKVANARCSVLKSGVFRRCHEVVPPEMFFAACVYDLCACGSNTDECVCDALEAYASECRHAGVVLQWRSPSLCAVGCPVDRGYVFDECGPPCPKTCLNKDVPLGVVEAGCFKPCVPGCQCPAGLVEHDAHCISPEKCPKIIHDNHNQTTKLLH
ncbi:LOW QUALITY PROTEIN: kielin/chordin-like protein [Chanos chanos]|uniref:LOW QUALITY PROTEIN: kielin/chordin-like protein n=1 Tax=Chanos chanos TaxID=29144 RepID=A0A6J2WRE9_CHACN|nr:LOW QUALITY PROTEIN: kielin/chordin-like protein [Chanos chanos]